MAGDGLRADESPRGVDLESFPPLGFGHFERRLAAYYPREAEEVVDGAEVRDARFEAFFDAFARGHVDCYAEDPCRGEVVC